MLYPAELTVQEPKETTWNRLEARLAEGNDLNDVLAVAGTVFRTERYYCDPRLNPEASDNRYCNWVKSTFVHHSQQLYVVKDGPEIAAFFVTEMIADDCCYWHLNAVSPAYQGKGVGFAAAQKMIEIAIEKSTSHSDCLYRQKPPCTELKRSNRLSFSSASDDISLGEMLTGVVEFQPPGTIR